MPVKVATSENGKANLKIPKMLSMAFGPAIGKADQKWVYVISSPMQATYIYEALPQ